MQSLVEKTVENTELLFSLGAVVLTQGVADLIEAGLPIWTLIARHAQGDWGELEEEDREENALSLERGFRLFSKYNVRVQGTNHRIWVITEEDRSVTTALLPVEY